VLGETLRPGEWIRPRRDGGARFRAGRRHVQTNSPYRAGVLRTVMLTSAIVFGMVGVAAGFTWDYLIKKDA
jgi:hypothetical protein